MTKIEPSGLSVPLLIAHRGYAKRFPENSLIGIEAALQAGAYAVEFDVQLTRDNTPVVCHDATLLRTGGVDVSVLSSTMSELAPYSVDETERLAGAFHGTPLPTLTQVVDLLRRWADVVAFVEIKEESLKAFGIERTVRAILHVLQPIADRTIIISYESLAIRCARAMGAISIGWVLHHFNNDVRVQATELAPDYLICNHTKIPPTPTPLWPGPWQWALYEITNPEVAMLHAKRGAALIETMAIGEMLHYPLLQKRARLVPATTP